MTSVFLPRDRFVQWLDHLLQSREVIAPVDEFTYASIKLGNEVTLNPTPPIKSAKEFFFPQREVLFEYQLGDDVSIAPPVIDPKPRVIITRPCEAASLVVLDKLFTSDYVDPGYVERRGHATIISVACAEPSLSCFCTSVGGSPSSSRGADLLLTPIRDGYHVAAVSERGRALLAEAPAFFREATADQEQECELAQANMNRAIRNEVDAEAARDALSFDNPAWEKVAQECLDCGVCTFLCPTCHCFDIQDEGTRAKGSRVRIWDSCAFASYTKMPVGQPRPEHYRRYRQRIMHKFQYYPENFGETLCVGCGRCIRHCPVGIDITEILKFVTEGVLVDGVH